MSSVASAARDAGFLDDMDRQRAGRDDPVVRLRRVLERYELVASAQLQAAGVGDAQGFGLQPRAPLEGLAH